MPTKGTPLRNVRVPDNVWDAAKAKARGEGTTVSDVVQGALRVYADKPFVNECGAVWYDEDEDEGRDCILPRAHKGEHAFE